MKTILLTGSTGFIGSSILKFLLNKHNLYCLNRKKVKQIIKIYSQILAIRMYHESLKNIFASALEIIACALVFMQCKNVKI